MEVTNAMLVAAMHKAVEAGLLARRPDLDESHRNREVFNAILTAALSASDERPSTAERMQAA